MHEYPLKRSVTAPHSSAHQVTLIKTKDLGSLTPKSLSRHRSASPNPQFRQRSSDSPRPSDILSHKPMVLGRLQAFSPSGTSSKSSASNVPVPRSEDGSSHIGRVYASADTSPKSSNLYPHTPSIVVSDMGGMLGLPVDYHSNASSQSHLSLYHAFRKDSPPVYYVNRGGSEYSGMSRLTVSESIRPISSGSERSVVRGERPKYATAEVHRICKSDPGGNTPEFQFPTLVMPGIPDLLINPEAFERKLVIEDPDPSFHRSLNSPATGEPPGEVVLEQVGSFHVHHLRNDSLGELPYISTVEKLPPSPPQLLPGVSTPKKVPQSSSSSEGQSQGGCRPSGMIRPPEAITTPSITVASGEITSSTVVLPGEYGRRRQHSRAGAGSQGHRNFSVDLQITSHIQPPPDSNNVTRVTPEGPPTTPDSPFTSGLREQTKLKGAVKDSSSPLVTFLSLTSLDKSGGDGMLVPPTKLNSNGILPAPSLETTAMCFAHAYGCQHIFLPKLSSPADESEMVSDIRASSPSLRSMRKILERHNRSILSNQ